VRFLGIDLGWVSQPTGVARVTLTAKAFEISALARRATHAEVLAWIDEQAGSGPAMLAIDAPLVIPNASGIRACERAVNADFRSYHAGCHAANQGRPFYRPLAAFVAALENRGFRHAVDITPRTPGRYMIEVHPHAAAVRVFGLERIIKYKKGRVADRARELGRYRELLKRVLGEDMPVVPATGRALKAVEDQLDAAFAAWIGANWWLYGCERSRLYGDLRSGYIVVPECACESRRIRL
jgi:predicted RNase H-like nuclease